MGEWLGAALQLATLVTTLFAAAAFLARRQHTTERVDAAIPEAKLVTADTVLMLARRIDAVESHGSRLSALENRLGVIETDQRHFAERHAEHAGDIQKQRHHSANLETRLTALTVELTKLNENFNRLIERQGGSFHNSDEIADAVVRGLVRAFRQPAAKVGSPL